MNDVDGKLHRVTLSCVAWECTMDQDDYDVPVQVDSGCPNCDAELRKIFDRCVDACCCGCHEVG